MWVLNVLTMVFESNLYLLFNFGTYSLLFGEISWFSLNLVDFNFYRSLWIIAQWQRLSTCFYFVLLVILLLFYNNYYKYLLFFYFQDLPWSTIATAVIPNSIALEICQYVTQHKSCSWRVPATHLSNVLGFRIDERVLCAICKGWFCFETVLLTLYLIFFSCQNSTWQTCQKKRQRGERACRFP